MINRYYFIFQLLLLTGLILSSSQALLAQSQTDEASGISTVTLNNSRFHIAINGGLGYLVGSTQTSKAQMMDIGISDKEADRYYDDFKSGQQAGLSVHYMLFPNTGIGVDYNIFTTSSQVMGLLLSNDQTKYFYGRFSEKIYTNYVGFSIQPYQMLTGKLALYEKISAGMAFYRNESQVFVAPALITGNNIAFNGEGGLSYQVYKHVSFNLGVSYFIASLKKFNLTDGIESMDMELEGESKENLSRLNLSAGIEFNF